MSSEISNEAIRVLASVLEARTGQQISPNRYWRIESVLKPVLKKYDIPDLDAMVAVVLAGGQDGIVKEAVEAMLNNESSFFRDQALFTLLTRPAMDAIREKNAASKTIRIWCAGCSTGQEVYSIAMTFADEPHKWGDWRLDIVGTDISESAIQRAKSGTYSQFEIQRGLPVTQMMRYFSKNEEDWTANPEIKNMIRFDTANLLTGRFPEQEYDIILCRNVLMYFDIPTRQEAFRALSKAIKPDGFLMLGAVETVIGQTEDFVASRKFRGLYIPRIGAEADELKPVLRRA